jgi:hypothetical protein
MLDFADLKFVIEHLATPTELDEHPLADAQFVVDYLQQHPEIRNLSKGRRLGWALADTWRAQVMPSRLALEYSKKWNKFLCLEVGYFYPFRHNALFPGSVSEIGANLSEPDKVAKVIADGDDHLAEELQNKDYKIFWQEILPSIDLGTVPPSTVYSRIKKAIELLQQILREEPSDAESEIEEASSPNEEQPPSASADVLPLATAMPVRSTLQEAESVVAKSYTLDAYEALLNRQWPTIVGYRAPLGRYTVGGISQEMTGTDAAPLFLEKHRTVLLNGETGIGKTTYLTQVIIPACRQLGQIPVLVSLPMYFDARDKTGDLSTFVREKVFGQQHPDKADKDQFARELAEAIRDQRVSWLLDGYDELTPRERGLLNQELEHLDRFVLTTRQIKPETRRTIEATWQLIRIDRVEALDYIGTRYSANARSRIEAWCERQHEAPSVLTMGWWLEETAQLAHDPSQVLSLMTVLDKAITRQLAAHARFQSTTSVDIYALARTALESLAFESLNPKRLSSEEPNRLNQNQLAFAWRSRSAEPEAIFFEVIRSTGLLVEEGKQWRFPSDLVRDELVAEFIQAEGFILSGRAFYPQYERPIGWWAARLMLARQHQRVVDLLNALRDLDDDPYGARWSLIVRILTECLPFENDRLRTLRLETEQALLEWWGTTSSNRMKWHINMWLYALGSQQIPEMRSGVLENALRDLDIRQPQATLPELMQQAGYTDLARRLAEGSRVDQQAVTQALIDIIAAGPGELVNEAAIHLASRNLEPTTFQRLSKESPIDRLAELARTRPMNQYVTPQDFKRAQAAQSAALGILGRPIVLANETLLKRIPADVIHSLMAELHLRIRKTDNRVVVITADGRDWVLKAD